MKILSLFDGISCARVALERVGIKVDAYTACEIDKYAMQISKKNYPDIVQVGSVTDLVAHTEPFDLIIGGSPCQDLSIAKKNRKGLDGERSGLFWEYVRILKEVKPKYFILENVASMPKEAKAIITEALGVEPIMINAALVSAQNRKRLFFCGQIRERLYFNDVLCYNCLQDENKGILGKTQDKGTEKILGETPERYCNMQNMQERIQKDRQEGHDQDLLNTVSGVEQKIERQESGQDSQAKVSENVSKKEQGEAPSILQEVSSVGKRQGENENCRQETAQDNSKENEISLSKGNNRNQETDDQRGGPSDSQYETDMCCVRCGKRLNNRPYRSFISGWNEQPRKSPSIMSEMQFNEARQNNGRVFDIYQLEITQPEDKGILLKDILEENVDEKYNVNSVDFVKGGIGKKNDLQFIGGVRNKDWAKDGKNYSRNFGQGDRVYSPDGKSTTLSASCGGRGAKTGLYAVKDFIRKLTPIECERLQGLPDNYTEYGMGLHKDNMFDNIKIWKNVLSKIVTGKKKPISELVLCITKDIKDMGLLNCITKQKRDVYIVIDFQSQENSATSIIKIGIGTKTHFLQISCEKRQGTHLIDMDINEAQLTELNTEMLWNNTSKENLENTRLFIISILSKLIIQLETSISVQNLNTNYYIVSLNKLLQNSLSVELYDLKKENIEFISNTQRYKALGNAFNVDVVAHILSFIPKN